MWYLLLYLATLYGVRAATFVWGDTAQFSEFFHDKYVRHLGLVRCHGVFAALTLLLGPWLLSSRLRQNWPGWHRRLGKLYAICLVPAALSGLWMSLMAFGGASPQTALVLLSLGWIYTAARAFLALRQRSFHLHQRWMVRHYALTLAAVTLRIQVAWRCGLGAEFPAIYAECAWCSWMLNLVLAECWLILRAGHGPAQARAQPAQGGRVAIGLAQ